MGGLQKLYRNRGMMRFGQNTVKSVNFAATFTGKRNTDPVSARHPKCESNIDMRPVAEPRATSSAKPNCIGILPLKFMMLILAGV
jgi:hypothetical protein